VKTDREIGYFRCAGPCGGGLCVWLAATLGRRPSLNQMSAFGPKQTCASALHMSAFGIKPDIAPIQGFRPILWRLGTMAVRSRQMRQHPLRTFGTRRCLRFRSRMVSYSFSYRWSYWGRCKRTCCRNDLPLTGKSVGHDPL